MPEMYFIKHASPKHNFSPSYQTLHCSENQALVLFNGMYRPFITGAANAVVKASLYSCNEEQDPGEETLMRECLCGVIGITQALRTLKEISKSSDRHPLDKTVFHKEIPDGLIDALRPLLYYYSYSFPNGSNYTEQRIECGETVLEGFGEATVNHGSNITVRIGKWDVYTVPGHFYRGSGADFGAYFCTRSSYLAAFRKKVEQPVKEKNNA